MLSFHQYLRSLAVWLFLLPTASVAQCVLKLAPEHRGNTDWSVEDTVQQQVKGFGLYKWVNPPPVSPLMPEGGAPMSPTDVKGLYQAIAAQTGLTEAQVAALPRRALRVVVTPEHPYNNADVSPKVRASVRRWALENGLDSTKIQIGESHEVK